MMLFTSGRYAAVTSTLALVIALGGTSYAAVKITGADIKDGTVTTADVKNHNLTLKDLSSSATSGLKGPKGNPGAPGAPGAPGTPGAKGDAGPSDAYAIPAALSSVQGLGASPTVLGTLALPAGKFLATGKTDITHNDGGGSQTPAGVTSCEIVLPGGAGPATELDVADLRLPTGLLLTTPVSVQAAFTLDTATNVQLVCATSGTNMTAGAVQFQAVKVGTLTPSAG